ncbi:hypothetical protein Bhyg_04705 [Pseudolycoriella hygida]|uniref:DUF4780 domain-containing protein n=1 Tax=Pseudolycoriella hygida TaxID=35572 RepID=A0A9Q0NFV3_9DIPT|nr:hypothetical protein Bhyg_04705 [Pseudolycoriella hygida]
MEIDPLISNEFSDDAKKTYNLETDLSEVDDVISMLSDEIHEDINEVSEETQPPRAPRSLFFGPQKKKTEETVAQGRRIPTSEPKSWKLPNKCLDNSASNANVNFRSNVNDTKQGSGTGRKHEGRKKFGTRNTTRHRNANPDKTGNPKQSKRPLSKGNSPVNAPKRKKTYSDVLTDDLILHLLDESGDIDEEKAGFGSIRMLCTSSTSASWLTKTIKDMSPPWDGALLTVMNAKDRKNNQALTRAMSHKRPTIRFFIPNGMMKLDFDKVKLTLKRQNPPSETSNWKTWKTEERELGVFYHVLANDEDVEIISAKGSRLFFIFAVFMPHLSNSDVATIKMEYRLNDKPETVIVTSAYLPYEESNPPSQILQEVIEYRLLTLSLLAFDAILPDDVDLSISTSIENSPESSQSECVSAFLLLP